MQKKNTFQTSYIPEKFAILNKIVKLKEDGEWNDGWKVIAVSSLRHKDDDLPDSHAQIKWHRKTTGDSQKK